MLDICLIAYAMRINWFEWIRRLLDRKNKGLTKSDDDKKKTHIILTDIVEYSFSIKYSKIDSSFLL